ncbi:MAG: hypothetical protein IPM74_13825 [Crocinitomicaceae bacterium]|nr:hypothetical protein [Crocinitomicaceae bacterium]
MKLYGLRAKRGGLQYYEEHIHYTLDGTPDYIWRKVQAQVNSFDPELNIKVPLEFVTSLCKFENLDEHQWLKTDFKLPIMSKELVNIFLGIREMKHKLYPVIIYDEKNHDAINENFVAFYLLEPFDCVDWSRTKLNQSNGQEYFNPQNAKYLSNINYPPIFKINFVQNGKYSNLAHFVSESTKEKYFEYGITGAQFEQPIG